IKKYKTLKMKSITCIIFLIFNFWTGYAQNRSIDSLELALRREKTDTGKIMKLIFIGDLYWRKGNDSALQYFTEAIGRSEKTGFRKGEIRARSSMAEYLYYVKTDFATALELFLINLEVEKKTADTNFIFWDTRHVGFIHQRIDDEAKQLEYTNMLRDLVNSGIFKDSAQLSIYRVITDNRLADIHGKLNNLDSAKYYRFKVYHFGKFNNDNLRLASGSLGLGSIYQREKQFDSAFYYYRVALEAGRKRPDVFRRVLLGMGKLYLELNQIDSAYYYADSAFQLSKKANARLVHIESLELLATIYNIRGQGDSAYNYLSRSILLKDSLFTTEKTIKVQNLNMQQSLQKLKQEQAEKQAVQEYKSRIKIVILAAGFGMLGIFLLLIYRTSRQRYQANKKIEKAYTDLKSTQAQLIQSEKMASLGELTAGIAHEIQNPLNFVNNFSEVNAELMAEMEEEINAKNFDAVKPLAKNVKENEEKIIFHGRRADAIVKSMLQHSRTGTGTKEPTDINALAEEYIRLSYHGIRAKNPSFNAGFETHLDHQIGKLNVVSQDIGRVLLNLMNNAFHAVAEKSKLEKNGYQPVVSIKTWQEPGKVLIAVKDNGNGIPQKVLDKIFQPFFTTKPPGEGTGLGLSLSYDIIKSHGGELKVETKETEGSIFIITLPI
ncbi:MAG: ATP-binding protein, partial [Chitinophagaceae bacterium]